MFTTNLKLADKYDYLSEKFAKAYEFLRSYDLSAFSPGMIEIDGKDIFANVQEYTTVPWEDSKFEAHNLYYDIQYIAEGKEMFGYVNREKLTEEAPYDDKYDIVLFEEPEVCGKILLEAGDFVIVPPEDAHKPKCAVGDSGTVKKIVIKVRV